MILAAGALTARIASGVSTVTVAVLARLLGCVDMAGPSDGADPPPDHGGQPTWWPEFEREFADYVAADRR